MDQRQQAGMQQEEQKENSQPEIQQDNRVIQERIEPENPIQIQAGVQIDAQQVVEMQEQKVNQQGNNQNISAQNEEENDNDEEISQQGIDVQQHQRERSSNQEANQNNANQQGDPLEPEQQEQAQQNNERQQGIEENQQIAQPVQYKQISNKELEIPEQQEIIMDQQPPEIQEDKEEILKLKQAQEFQQKLKQAQQLEQKMKQAQQLERKIKQSQQLERKMKQAEQIEQRRQQEIASANKLAFEEQKKAEQNEAYINRLEKLIENLRDSLAKSKNQQSTLRSNNKDLSAQVLSSKQTNLEFRKKKIQLQMEERKLRKEVEKLKKENGEYKQKLAEIEKIGNILVLQSSIQELKLLTSSQSEEIEQLKASSKQQAHNYYQQQFNQLEAYQLELSSAKQHIGSLGLQIQQLKEQIKQLETNKSDVQIKNHSLQQEICSLNNEKQSLKDQISNWHKKWESVQEQRSEYKKSKQLDQRVSQYESERFLGQENDVQIISTLSDKQQKNLLLKEYLKLQTLYEESKIKQEQAEINLKRVIRDSKIKQANVIRKKDYQDLLAKYKKAKNCLEGAFLKIKNLQNTQSNPAGIQQEVNQLLQGNSSRLCQAVIKKTNEQLKNITEKVNQMQLNDEIIELKKQNSQLKQSQGRLQKQLKNNERILYLMNDEIQVRKKVIEEKCKVIQQYIDNGYHHKNEHFRERISQLEREVSRLNGNLSIYEVKNVLLIQENQSYLHQMNHWKNLYNNIKEKLSQRINVSLLESQKPIIQHRMQVQSYFCKQCQKRSLSFTNDVQHVQSEAQTQNLYDLHYKEIKQTLLCLKNIINKEISENIPESHKKTIKIISQFKEKYEKYVEKYNLKLMQLKKERTQNQAWRSKTRQQIRDQFQQIRDLVGNSRLITALRQAKSLIDYLQNEQQKGQEEQKSQNPREEQQEENNEAEQK